MLPINYTQLGSTALLILLALACFRYLTQQIAARDTRIRELEAEIKGLNKDAADLLAKRAEVDKAMAENMGELLKGRPGGAP